MNSSHTSVSIRRRALPGRVHEIVGRWRRFERQLQPLITELPHVGIGLQSDV